jgi:hypothetical protein
MLYKYAFHTLAPSVFSGFCEILSSLHLLTFTSSSDIQITSRCSSPKQHFFPPTFTIYNKFSKLLEICYNMSYHINIILHINIHTSLNSKSNSLPSWHSQAQWQENGNNFIVLQKKRQESFKRQHWEQTGSIASQNNLKPFYLPIT